MTLCSGISSGRCAEIGKYMSYITDVPAEVDAEDTLLFITNVS